MIACTARWSSMALSLTGAPGKPPPPLKDGKIALTGTVFLPGPASDGGRWYEELRKNESHDCFKSEIYYSTWLQKGS